MGNTNSNTTVAKMTNAKALAWVLENVENIPTDVAEKITNIKASIEKKNATKSDKPTKTQTENLAIKSAILNGMTENRLYTITEMIKEIPALDGMTNQKVSSLVRQLVESGSVARTEDKRKAYFSIIVAPTEDTDDVDVDDVE